MDASGAFGTFGCALLGLAVLLTAVRVERLSRRGVRLAIALILALVLFVPLGDLPAAAYVRSVTGDPGVSTLFLAGAACLARLGGRVPIGERDRRALWWLLAGAALFLYPAALGLTGFDPYALGYGSPAFATALLLIALAAWRAGLNAVVLVLVVAAFAYLLGVYESRNLWDYLLDPLGCGYALVRLISRRESTRAAPAS
ncbi:MAG: hypothetical protein WBO23_07260 [Burkholderiales bacterium]